MLGPPFWTHAMASDTEILAPLARQVDLDEGRPGADGRIPSHLRHRDTFRWACGSPTPSVSTPWIRSISALTTTSSTGGWTSPIARTRQRPVFRDNQDEKEIVGDTHLRGDRKEIVGDTHLRASPDQLRFTPERTGTAPRNSTTAMRATAPGALRAGAGRGWLPPAPRRRRSVIWRRTRSITCG